MCHNLRKIDSSYKASWIGKLHLIMIKEYVLFFRMYLFVDSLK